MRKSDEWGSYNIANDSVSFTLRIMVFAARSIRLTMAMMIFYTTIVTHKRDVYFVIFISLLHGLSFKVITS